MVEWRIWPRALCGVAGGSPCRVRPVDDASGPFLFVTFPLSFAKFVVGTIIVLYTALATRLEYGIGGDRNRQTGRAPGSVPGRLPALPVEDRSAGSKSRVTLKHRCTQGIPYSLLPAQQRLNSHPCTLTLPLPPLKHPLPWPLPLPSRRQSPRLNFTIYLFRHIRLRHSSPAELTRRWRRRGRRWRRRR